MADEVVVELVAAEVRVGDVQHVAGLRQRTVGPDLAGQPLLARASEREHQVTLVRGLAEHPRDAGRLAETTAGGLVHHSLRDVTEEVGPFGGVREGGVGLAQRHVDDVVGEIGSRPPRTNTGPVSSRSAARPCGIDREDAIDLAHARFRRERLEHGTDGREVRRQVHVLEVELRSELPVPLHVVGGRGVVGVPDRFQVRIPHPGAQQPADVDVAVAAVRIPYEPMSPPVPRFSAGFCTTRR